MASALISSDEDSDVGDLSCVRPNVVVPYNYEPLAHDMMNFGIQDSSSDSSGESDTELPLIPLSDWCSCDTCQMMPMIRENVCCQYYAKICSRMDGTEYRCITQHPGFQSTCLDIYVLEMRYYEFICEDGPQDDFNPIHEQYRYLAYRNFVRWIFIKLGRNVRKILPACVVVSIRARFPSAHYCGFKYPQLTVDDLL